MYSEKVMDIFRIPAMWEKLKTPAAWELWEMPNAATS